MEIDTIKNLAKAGDANGQFILGIFLENGYLLDKDEQAAAQWYEKSASQGYAPAQHALSQLLWAGRGITKNQALAYEYCHSAADKGYLPAQLDIAVSFEQGIGIEADQKKCLEWINKAVGKNYNPAITYLALKYAEGLGVEKNIEQAEILYRRAAENGDAEGAFHFALICLESENQTDIKKGLQWLNFSASKNYSFAHRKLSIIYKDGLYGVSSNQQKSYDHLTTAEQLENKSS